MDADDPLADCDAAGLDLLRLYEALEVPALLVTLVDGAIYVRCQNAGDVLPLCRRVVEQYEAPTERTLN